MAYLRSLRTGQEIPLEGPRLIMGRHPDCDIKLEDGSVSREHAQVVLIDGQYYIEDLHSRNGTFVNDTPITARHRLAENDFLKICDLEFTYHGGRPGEGAFEPHPLVAPEGASWKLVDDEGGASTSTIMSKLDLASTDSGMRLLVRPEIKLQAMIEITHNLGRALALDEVLRKTLDSLFKIFVQADRGFVALIEGPGKPVVPRAFKHRRGDGETIRISRTTVERVLGGKEAILSADAASDSRFDMAQSIADFRIRSMMCAPLLDSDGTPLGVIQIDTLDQRARFQQEDLDVLASVAQQAALAIENSRLHKTVLENERLARDLELAHQVQQGFLPSRRPELEGFEFFDFYEAAAQLGGDYFGYVPLPDERLAVVLADVSGKGIPAALLMAKLSAEVRFQLASRASPAEAVTELNRSFAEGDWADRFVTLVVAVIDRAEGRVTLVNAGHMAPLWRRSDGAVEEFAPDAAGLPVGVDDDVSYEQVTAVLAPGECLVLFTDGISEAMDAEGRMFGLERVRNVLQNGPKLHVAEVGQSIIDQVRAFAGRRPQSDDMCLACFGRC